MYENFLTAYPADKDGKAEPFSNSPLMGVDGFRELARLGAGKGFGGGIIRIHSKQESDRAACLIADAFPEYRGVVPVAKDWLGRQYAVPVEGCLPRAGMILLIEPGSGEAFEIDCGLIELFDQEMVNDPLTFLAADLFSEWKQAHPEPIHAGKCAGFKVPLFLGGEGSVENLEVTDESVYWNLFGQLRKQATGRG
ncbi:T6SS immunity protein Tdi1 domain-containing protein [Streptomyces sp. NPDC048385]|uniref:T6SS immunity protein Tdi1 domain-containing protein n=1 Tax=unclassified Streptomyces TaxID=2593676 RepID=UPI003448AE08